MNKKLMVKHYPQVPCKSFDVPVSTVEEAVKIMDVLAEYDLFQYENNIKPDYSNASVLVMWDEDDKDWISWDIEVDGEWFDDPLDYLEYLKKRGK